MEERERKSQPRLPGISDLFGIRSTDPLSSLQAISTADLVRSHSNTSALRSSLAPTPSLASSSRSEVFASRSDPFAFSLSDNLSVRSFGATSSSEHDDARSIASREREEVSMSPPPWPPAPVASPQSHSLRRTSKQRRISRNLDTLSAMRGYSEIGPPSAPPRSSSLQSFPAPANASDTESLEEGSVYRRGSYNMAGLEESLLYRPPSHLSGSSPATERGGFSGPLDDGSDTTSLRSTYSTGARSARSDVTSSAENYHSRRLPTGYSSHTSESSPRSSISTAPTSVRTHEESFGDTWPPSAFGARGRRSIEMAAELPPSHLDMRRVEYPLTTVLPSVTEAPVRLTPPQDRAVAPTAPPIASTSSALPPSAPSPTPSNSLSASNSLRYPCPHCYKRFSRPSSLRIHVFSHTGEKPYVCKICGRGFSVQSNLRRHGRIHTTGAAEAAVVPEQDSDDDGEMDTT